MFNHHTDYSYLYRRGMGRESVGISLPSCCILRLEKGVAKERNERRPYVGGYGDSAKRFLDNEEREGFSRSCSLSASQRAL